MIGEGVSEEMISLICDTNDCQYFMSLPHKYYEEMKKYYEVLDRSQYCISYLSADISWKDPRTENNFLEVYKEFKNKNNNKVSDSRIADILKYADIMKNDTKQIYPPPILIKIDNNIQQVDGARRMHAMLLAYKATKIPIHLIIKRSDLKDILPKIFIEDIKNIYNTKRWFNSYQDIIEIGFTGTRHYNGRFPKHLDLSRVDNRTVVDFGCSNGMALFQAYYCGAKTCIGFDYVKENVDIINKLAEQLHIPVFAYQIDFNSKGFEKQVLDIIPTWDYSLFLSVYRTKELKDRDGLLNFVYENSKIGMFFEGHGNPSIDTKDFYLNVLNKLKNAKIDFLVNGIIEKDYDIFYRPKFFIRKDI